ncbi:MAG: SOS response-associated peptidase [Bacteroidota bacterium]
MCGRYTLTKVPEESVVVYPETEKVALIPRFNVAPTQLMPVIPMTDPKRIHFYRWGLIPNWAKDKKIGYKMINARSETLLQKAAFKTPFRQTRCLVPADGFYEWKQTLSGKQPYRITLQDEALFYFAGLYDVWRSPQGENISTYSVITTEPNELVLPIHDRMPVILDAAAAERWLSPQEQAEDLQEILRPYPAEEMKAYPVSPEVGSVRNESERLIRPYEPPPTLF